jgi:hypothetical protein
LCCLICQAYGIVAFCKSVEVIETSCEICDVNTCEGIDLTCVTSNT